MSILIEKNTKIICQGFTGRQGTLYSKKAILYGTKIVGGVTPGKGGNKHLGLPIFNTVREAVTVTHAKTSVIYVPASYCKDAILESIDSGIKLIVCITEGIPIMDMFLIKQKLKENNVKMLGPNCPGIISPGKCIVGTIPDEICHPGYIGIVSRSGTLSYEIIKQITNFGLGQSSCVGIGGDPIIGLDFIDIIKMFEEDPETKIILMIGEIGGNFEEKAAFYIKNFVTKPVICYIAGIYSPKNKQMGHAGAFIFNEKETAKSKILILKKCGIKVVNSPLDIKKLLQSNTFKNLR